MCLCCWFIWSVHTVNNLSLFFQTITSSLGNMHYTSEDDVLLTQLFTQCHRYHSWLAVLPENVTYTLVVDLQLLSVNLQYGDSLHFMCQISCLFSFVYVIPKNPSKSESLHNICNELFLFYGEFIFPLPTSRLENHPLLSVRNFLLTIFWGNLHIWRLSPTSATWGHGMLWWQGTLLNWWHFQHSR